MHQTQTSAAPAREPRTDRRIHDEPSRVASVSTDIQQTAELIVRRAESSGFTIRIIGGVAIAIHSGATAEPPLARTYEDIDLVIGKGDRSRIDGTLQALGWEGDRRFNALNGSQRRIYYRTDGPKIDVFVGTFNMCHEIVIGERRLALDTPTVPLAELVLTKAQIVHLNQKDVTDLVALFVDHSVADHDDDAINAKRIADLCANDWGLWRTITGTLEHVVAGVDDVGLGDAKRQLVVDRVKHLREAIDGAKKSGKWKMRNRVGERVTWYELPEEPHQGP